MTLPGVRTLAQVELGTRISSIMRRPLQRPPRRARHTAPAHPVLYADARFRHVLPRPLRPSALGWSLLLAAQLGAALLAGTAYLAVTAPEPPAAELPALVPLVP